VQRSRDRALRGSLPVVWVSALGESPRLSHPPDTATMKRLKAVFTGEDVPYEGVSARRERLQKSFGGALVQRSAGASAPLTRRSGDCVAEDLGRRGRLFNLGKPC
jgi:hypothetical protein